ncbi:MAG: pterin-4-alpha-carbinolamine dehydratase [Pseudonocardiales bacterium]|nr:pterin-4-alpha-carbinolamine dehydratase [Pseudonocardiales bacterium]
MTDPNVRSRIQVCIDCADDQRLQAFWAAALDYQPHFVGGWRHVIDAAGAGPVVWFQPVPEPKVAKNRLHLDVWFGDDPAAAAKRDDLIDLGGTAVRREHDFWLMHDPEGNEFCLCWPVAPVGPVAPTGAGARSPGDQQTGTVDSRPERSVDHG